MKLFHNGLVVGKFSPLHKGHEFIIRRAFEQCENVFIFSYSSPEFAGCETFKRDLWLNQIFPEANIFVFENELIKSRFNFDIPNNDADDLTQRRFLGFLWLEFVNKPLNAVFTSEDYGFGFADEISRYFSLYTSFPKVEHILVDLERQKFPISGTKIRENVHKFKDFLSPEIYASFVKRVCFLGGESTGKSTITARLAEKFNTEFVAEFGRTLWEEKAGNLEFSDLLKIAKVHTKQEDEAAQTSKEFLFIDTTPLTTLFYSLEMFGKADIELNWLANRKYDFTFLCSPDFPLVQDGTRQNEDFRKRQHEWYLKLLTKKGIQFTILKGDIEERIKKVSETIY